MAYQTIRHTFEPVFDGKSEVLILGSLPSLKSRENGFYYGHPQNRFWRVLAAVLGTELPETTEAKKSLLLASHIALWDVIAQCDIEGSSDSSIRNVIPNDINVILTQAPIRQIYANGNKAFQLYCRYCQPLCGREAQRLPSTSPANAAWQLNRLTEAWRCITGHSDG